MLDKYKESKPKDPTIREKFNTYQFADYKDHVIELLAKVCTVSVKTQTIVEAMKNFNRQVWKPHVFWLAGHVFLIVNVH